MAHSTYLYIIMYDITHARTLQKVAKLTQQYGYERINYSVWYGAGNPSTNTEFRTKLKTLLDNAEAKGSRMYFLPIKAKDMEKMRTHDGKKLAEMEYWLGRQKTLFF